MKSKFDPQKHHRRSIRLKNYDYASGAYYVTIVTYKRECLFGEIVDNEMYLSTYGEVVQKWWGEIPIYFPNVNLAAFVVMPNHVHGIIVITAPNQINQNFNDTEFLPQWKESLQQGGKTPPYATQHWDKLLLTSNINPRRI